MSGTGKVLGSSTTTTAGIAILPNTGGNTLLTIFGISLIVIGGLVLTSFVGTRLYARLAR